MLAQLQIVITITSSLHQSYNPKHPPARGADGFMVFYTHSESSGVDTDLSVKNLAYTGFCGFEPATKVTPLPYLKYRSKLLYFLELNCTMSNNNDKTHTYRDPLLYFQLQP